MAPDRLARIAFRFGALAVAIELWIAFAFVRGLRDDMTEWVKKAPIEQLPYRYSQLKPWWVKSPLGLGVTTLFTVALVALVIYMFCCGLQRLRDGTRAEQQSERNGDGVELTAPRRRR